MESQLSVLYETYSGAIQNEDDEIQDSFVDVVRKRKYTQ